MPPPTNPALQRSVAELRARLVTIQAQTNAGAYAEGLAAIRGVAQEFEGYNADVARDKCTLIYDTMMSIFERAAAENAPTGAVADRIVDEMIFED